jgi:DNA polymerase elongation subunit (family B)
MNPQMKKVLKIIKIKITVTLFILFGRTLDGKSVYMKVVNFTPYFYIKLPENWNKSVAKNNVKKYLTI